MNRHDAARAELRGGRDHTVRIRQEEIGRDGDISAWSLHRLGEDLTVQEQDELRINIHAAAAARAVEDRRADGAISEFDGAAGVGRDFDRAATRLVGLCRDFTIGGGKALAGVDRDIACDAGAGAAARDVSAVLEHDRVGVDQYVPAGAGALGFGGDAATGAVNEDRLRRTREALNTDGAGCTGGRSFRKLHQATASDVAAGQQLKVVRIYCNGAGVSHEARTGCDKAVILDYDRGSADGNVSRIPERKFEACAIELGAETGDCQRVCCIHCDVACCSSAAAGSSVK